MVVAPFPLREVRWLWVKLRRRIEMPLRNRRIRAEQAAPHARQQALPALPWQVDASVPGWTARLPWRMSWQEQAAGSDCNAADVFAHRLQLLSATKCSVNSIAMGLSAEALDAARELPAASAAAYRPIEWHGDFHSGHRWDPAQFYLDVRVAPVAGADIKIPRELSRFQHTGALALGAPEEGAVEFLLQVLDWIAANPPRRGVNWACTMDVALRAINWIWGLRLFEPVLTRYPQALRHVTASIHQHGVHIENNLEYYEESTGNHYLSDIAGLLYIGAAFPQFPEADRWLLFALQELVSEMEREVYADGGAHEASTHYHRLVGELFVSCAALAERLTTARRGRLQQVVPSQHRVRPRLRSPRASGLNLQPAGALLPAGFYAKLARVGEFTAALTKPNGRVPQIGDNDSARAHKLMPWIGTDVRNHAHLVASIGQLLGREDLQAAGVRAREEALLIAGGLASPGTFPPSVSLGASTTFFAQSGVAVMSQGPAWLCVTCGPNGQGGRGGHGHNDKLSFELNVHGVDFVVDGGCPAYSAAPHVRNRFRSTWAHSTVAVSGKEQDSLPQGQAGLFQLPERCKPRLKLEADGSIRGSHSGYGAPHRRRFVLSAQRLEIEDFLDLDADRWLVFNLDPAIEVRELAASDGRAECLLVHARGARVRLSVQGVDDAKQGEGCFGIGYGEPQRTSNVCIRMARADTRATFTWNP